MIYRNVSPARTICKLIRREFHSYKKNWEKLYRDQGCDSTKAKKERSNGDSDLIRNQPNLVRRPVLTEYIIYVRECSVSIKAGSNSGTYQLLDHCVGSKAKS